MELDVLLVEDDANDAELLLRRLRADGIVPRVGRARTEAELRDAIAAGDWQVALVDYNLPGFGGTRALEVLADIAPDLPAVTVSGAISEETAVATLTAGAVDYVLKDNLTRLALVVRRAVEGADLRRHARLAAEQARQSQFAVDHASQAIVYVAEDGILLYVNRAAEELGGVPAEAAVGTAIWGWAALVGEEEWRRLWQAASDGPIVGYEANVTRPGGERRTVTAALERLDREQGPFMIAYVRDVTELRRAEELAHETEERLARLTDNLADIVFRLESAPEPHVAYVNAAVESVLGFTPEEWRTFDRAVLGPRHAEYARALRELWEAAEASGEPLAQCWTARDETVRWLESRLTPVRGADGTIVAVEGVARDVTDVRRATEQLAHSRDLLDYVISHARSAIAVHDRDLNYVYVSRRYLEEYGVREENVIGRHHYDIFPDLPEKWREVHRRALAGEVSSADRDPYERADGTVEWTRWECRPWYEVDGSVGGIIVYTEVITDRVLAEAALRESEERFRRVSELTTDLAFSCIRSPGGAFRFDWLSGAVERITGHTREELLEMGCWRPLVLEEDLAIFDRHVVGLPPGESDACELRIRDAAGTVRWLAIFSEMVASGDDDGAHHLFGACQDITERKLAERELRESEERFARFAERIPGLVTMKDADHHYLYVGGLSEPDHDAGRDWLGKTPSEVWPAEQAAHSDAVADRVLAGAVVDETSEWWRRGGRRFFHALHFPIPREDGPPLIGGLALDVTEEHEAQAEVMTQAERLRRIVEGAVHAMSYVVETRDPYTAGHERRVAELAVPIAERLGLPPSDVEGLRLAALIHDIGKVCVPVEILSKPGRLSETEFSLIKQHAQAGHDIMAAVEFEQPVAEIVLQHHERLDGTGYPRGLGGDAILPEARILAVADVIEAMSSHRPYRAALGMAAALDEVRAGAGVRYDAEVVAACVGVFEDGFTFTA